MMDRQYRARRGQAIVIVALAMVALCGIAAVSVDVGMATSKQHLLRNAASTASLDARQLFADHDSPITTTRGMVWNSINASLQDAGLSVGNTTGTNAPADPCVAGYTGNQVALTAIYLNSLNVPITDTAGSPITITASQPMSSVPDGAAGVQIGLGACQAAAFGGVIGHPRYTIAVNALAGQPSIAATNTPGPTSTSYPTDTPTNTPTSTPTNTPTPPGPTSTPTTTPTTTPTSTATSTSSPTATPAPTLCTISVPWTVGQSYGFYTSFTTSGTGDITATWTITPSSSSGSLYVGLYSGTPLTTTAPPVTGGSDVNPSTDPSLTSSPGSLGDALPQMKLVSLGAQNNVAQTETLTYTQAAAGTYTVYFYNSNNKTNPVGGVKVSYLSRSCPGSATAMPTTSATATPTTGATVTATPTNVPTSTATVTPPPTATATPGRYPYSVSAAPDGPWCNGKAHLIQPETDRDANYQPEEYYCRGVFSIGSQVVVYANGNGLGNDYTHDSNFKGYIKKSSLWWGLTQNAGSTTAFYAQFDDEVDTPEPSGEGNNAPSAPCPAKMDLPLISRIAHHGSADYFAPLGIIQVTIDSCGDPTTGVISGVIYDPHHIVTLPSGATLPYYP